MGNTLKKFQTADDKKNQNTIKITFSSQILLMHTVFFFYYYCFYNSTFYLFSHKKKKLETLNLYLYLFRYRTFTIWSAILCFVSLRPSTHLHVSKLCSF